VSVRRLVVVTAAVALVLALARPAAAHQTSVKYVDLDANGAELAVTFKVAAGDVTDPLGLPADARPSADEASTPDVARYVQHWLAIDGCTADVPAAHAEGSFVVVTWVAHCATAARTWTLDFTTFFATDQRHEAFVQLHGPGISAKPAIVRAGDARFVLQASGGSLTAWIRAGMHHIYEGRDHISFVLALLLVVMLVRGDGTWLVRRFVPTLRSTGVVITAFTVGHSISLIAASLGWVTLPRQLVESLIALSIAYTAVEDIAKPEVRWRFALTFAFGLVHGLGFARDLAVMLPPHDVVVPLLLFNVGVELGQLTIVAVALPVLFLVAVRLGGRTYRRVVMPAIAALIAAAGAVWILERVFEVTILGM
jgi:hypothetical protein